MENLNLVYLGISFGALIIGSVLGYYTRQTIARKQAGTIESKLNKMVSDAKEEAKETLLKAKEKSGKILEEIKEQERARQTQLTRMEERLLNKEQSFDQKSNQLEKEYLDLKVKVKKVRDIKEEITKLHQEEIKKLEKVAKLSQEKAKEELLSIIEKEHQEVLLERMNRLEKEGQEELNKKAERRMVVLRPLKVTITNYPENKTEELTAVNNPEDSSKGTRKVPFSREIYIEKEDFQETPHKKFFRLAPGREVRLRYAYFITCQEVIKDKKTGEVTELRCTYDPATKGGDSPDGRKVKGTIHWVSAEHSEKVSVRLYDPLFTKRNPEETKEGQTYKSNINPDSLEEIKSSRAEQSLKTAEKGVRYQFERQGYFVVDPKDSSSEQKVFNRIVSLRDTWKKIEAKTA